MFVPSLKKKDKLYESMPETSVSPRIQKLVTQHFNTDNEEDDITDAEGLRRAYNNPNRLHKHGDRLYVAGTTWPDDKMDVSKPPWDTTLLKDTLPGKIPDNFSLNDAIDDLKIPEFKTEIYKGIKTQINF